MSLRVNVKAPSSKKVIEKLKAKLHSPEFIQQIQSEVVEGQIKRLIRSGQSPIEGFGRFVQYKDKDSYPAGEKPATPANLFLSGGMLRLYTVARKTAMSIGVGISEAANKAVKVRAKANNEGTLGLEGKKFDKKLRDDTKEKNLPLFRQGKKASVRKIVEGSSGVPARRFIPIGKESFTKSVIFKLKNLYAKRVKSLLSKG